MRGRKDLENSGKLVIALTRLFPMNPESPSTTSARPKVGEMIDKPFHIPDSALAPLTEKELKEWGL